MISHTTSTDRNINKVITIHQPTFFPWYPFFKKMNQADIFIFLSHCQFEKNGYQNRFNIGPRWYTMGVRKGMLPIVEKQYANPTHDWKKIKKGLSHSHGRMLDHFDDCISDSLYKTNVGIIKKICKILGIETELKPDYLTEKTGTERLVDICINSKASEYISGIGGKKYLDVDIFLDSSITVEYQELMDSDRVPILDILKDKF